MTKLSYLAKKSFQFYNSGYREGALKEQQKLEHHIGELTKNLEIASAFIQQFHFNHSVNNGGGSGGVGSGGERSGVEGSVQHNQFDQCSSHLPMNGPLYGGGGPLLFSFFQYFCM